MLSGKFAFAICRTKSNFYYICSTWWIWNVSLHKHVSSGIPQHHFSFHTHNPLEPPSWVRLSTDRWSLRRSPSLRSLPASPAPVSSRTSPTPLLCVGRRQRIECFVRNVDFCVCASVRALGWSVSSVATAALRNFGIMERATHISAGFSVAAHNLVRAAEEWLACASWMQVLGLFDLEAMGTFGLCCVKCFGWFVCWYCRYFTTNIYRLSSITVYFLCSRSFTRCI